MKKYWIIKVVGKNEYSFIIYCDAEDEHKAIGMALKSNLFNDTDDANYAVAEEADEIAIKVYETCKCCFDVDKIN
jgi:hypothetical protein